LAGRIDLAQAEAVLGVIDAADNRELNVALTQLAGGLSQPLDSLRNTLLNLCADLEAGLDFVEDDIEFISKAAIERELTTALDTIRTAEQQMESRDQGTQLPRVVLRGEANAGKSSLWNAMCDDADAIVTDQAGTTRDYLTGVGDLDGVRFRLIDTAGVEHGESDLQQVLRQTTDGQADSAELVLLCIDGSRELTEWERRELANRADNVCLVQTKVDLEVDDDVKLSPAVVPDACTSDRDQVSVERLIRICGERLETLSLESSVVSSTAVRCRESLRLAKESVERALGLTVADQGDELIAVELRTTLEHLGQIVGAIYTDDILDRIFSRFCIGK
jgi:tRNA modification GTPase